MKENTRRFISTFVLACMTSATFMFFGVDWHPAKAQVTVPGYLIVPLGYCQLTSLGSATKLSACSGGIPAGATMAYIEAEAQAIRYRDDPTAPSATVGMPVAVGAPIFYAGTLSAVQIIEQTGGAKVNILFYR